MATYRTSNQQETHHLGVRLGSKIRPPRTVLLCGELGAGKTILAKGLAQGLAVEDPDTVHSPTFSLINEYPTAWGTVYHVDLYRLETRRQQDSVGLQEILDSEGVVLIEWAERLKLEAESPVRIEISTPEEDVEDRVFKVRGLAQA